MKTVDYGTVNYNGQVLTLKQNPYLNGTDEWPRYEARAISAEGDEYMVVWQVIDGWEDKEDESDCCDWDDFIVKELH